MTIGEALVQYLEARGIEVIFGIPGVHTIELYRGLAKSKIRHITARHEQGVGFMADSYARVSGKVGVAFVITGPGITNMLTPMAQARADSVPLLVISGVNEAGSQGLGHGYLHELPDQLSLCAQVAKTATEIREASALVPCLDQAFTDFTTLRPAPIHVQIPTNVMKLPFAELIEDTPATADSSAMADASGFESQLNDAVARLLKSKKTVILTGGGAKHCDTALRNLAETLAAPVVLTTNGRGLMHQHPLCVPASPSLEAVRELIRKADCVLAVGTEIGHTDYDAYRDNGFPEIAQLIRIDISTEQLTQKPAAVGLQGDSQAVLSDLQASLDAANKTSNQNKDLVLKRFDEATARAADTRAKAQASLSDVYQGHISILNTLRDCYPDTYFIGDSTQLIYAGGMYYDHDRPGGWFNAATGFGALGYAIPAAIGAALAKPKQRIVCICGDGGAQFTLPELMTAVQETLNITFVIWNNRGYLEIESSMASAGIEVVGCDPQPPVFEYIAKACGITFTSCSNSSETLVEAIDSLSKVSGPTMIEIKAFQ